MYKITCNDARLVQRCPPPRAVPEAVDAHRAAGVRVDDVKGRAVHKGPCVGVLVGAAARKKKSDSVRTSQPSI